jgi:hypothetical protein
MADPFRDPVREAIVDAACAGDLEALWYMCARGDMRFDVWKSQSFMHAAASGRVHVLEWVMYTTVVRYRTLYIGFMNLPYSIACRAVEDVVHWDVLVFMCMYDPENAPRAICAAAATYGRLDVLKQMWRSRVSADGIAFANAASRRRFDVLEWLLTHSFATDDQKACACASAALHGYLDVLEFLRARTCPWDPWTFACASKRGHLDVMHWLLEQGCPWDSRVFLNASPAVVRWLEAHGMRKN